jgi:hypothetical protein
MNLRTRRPIRSEFHPSQVYPAGSEAVLVQVLDTSRGIWLIEIRVPDEALVGGACYDVVESEMSDLEEVPT